MKFNLASSNLTKILLLPIYALVALLAAVMPRNRRLWVFGRKPGFGEGPLRVLEKVRERIPDSRLIWIAQDLQDARLARDAGVECYPRTSWAACIATIRAGHIIVTHGLGDVVRPASVGARLVQLWHGTPLKQISLDSPASYGLGGGILAHFFRKPMWLAYKLSFQLPYAYVVPSEICARRFQSAFDISADKTLMIGDPRCDCLHAVDRSVAHMQARATLAGIWQEATLPTKLYLYAPTWRDGEPDPGIPDQAERVCLARLCKELNAWIVVRSHPFGFGVDDICGNDVAHGGFKFLPASLANDVTPLLHAFDGLITDYSAIAIDYSALERPIYFFAPDLDKYERERGMYEPYVSFTEGAWSSDWAGVTAAMARDIHDEDSYRTSCARSHAMKTKYHHHIDGNAAVRLVEHLVAGS